MRRRVFLRTIAKCRDHEENIDSIRGGEVGTKLGKGVGVRRVKHVAMALTMAGALGWSGAASDARASHSEVVPATGAALELPQLQRSTSTTTLDDGQWRYVATRR